MTVTVHTNDGAIVQGIRNIIAVNNGEVYQRIGSLLTGTNGVISHNVKTDEDAMELIIRLHGGQKG